MLKKRIIPCLDIKDGRTVKGINFEGIRDAGDPVELARKYSETGADELVFLDITATVEKRKTLIELVERISEEIQIPFTVGGGIKSVEDAVALVRAGADKISVNSSAVNRPELIRELAKELGSQCVVLAIDTKVVKNEDRVVIRGGRNVTKWRTVDWAKEGVALGAGEILLTSMGRDGTKDGFDIGITNKVANEVNVPIIASGGAGSMPHFTNVFSMTKATGALAASVFHFGEIAIPDLKDFLKTQNIAVR
ncbi:MAG: imidazole glycerol phosphate synthase subunit HisF [Fluviicola sp. XM-24bin1]|nr:MAG: imidazole glycerol phosphate synthase subunit HisF [Fluviicola sp. XM-24bin1]